MITIYKEVDKKLESFVDQENIKENICVGSWINVTEPNVDDIKLIAELTGITYSFLSAVLDEEETAHIDVSEGNTLVVSDGPYARINSNDEKEYLTLPFFIAYNEKYIVTLCSKKIGLIDSLLVKTKKIEPVNHVRLTLLLQMRIASEFIVCLRQIDLKTKDVERKLHDSMKNKEIFSIMELNKSLVYFSTALNASKNILQKINRLPDFKQNIEDLELLEDVAIEVDQAIEMSTIYREIMAGKMDAYASIISNNVNSVMKALAVITIVIAIPTLFASFFGMNLINIPLSNNKFGFLLVVIISIIASVIGYMLLFFLPKKFWKK